jgi:hypothetical protein
MAATGEFPTVGRGRSQVPGAGYASVACVCVTPGTHFHQSVDRTPSVAAHVRAVPEGRNAIVSRVAPTRTAMEWTSRDVCAGWFRSP